MRIELADHDELPGLCRWLDEEFIFGKGRSVSFAQRFPALFREGSPHSFVVARHRGQPLAALAIKRFRWRADGQRRRGAMIGLVWTHPEHRGKGLGTQVLQAAEQAMRDSGEDFAVLWTTKPVFYARLGWISSDIGLFGEAIGAAAGAGAAAVAVETPALGAAPALAECEHARRLAYVEREDLDYLALPVPAVQVRLLRETQGRGYALVGGYGDAAVVYEVIGDEAAFEPIWQATLSLGNRVLVNDCRGSLFHRWLGARARWQPQSLAMWKVFSGELAPECFWQWHIPYFDRI